ncbi:MAG TPA: hypothetical protein VFE91_07940 [Nitrososphaerales archaeon]|nr:hypothetical protein [Nitrososphaerales archaeon]
MGSSESRSEELLDRVVLEIKAMVLLEGSDSALKEKLQSRIVDTHDDSLRRFTKAMQVGGARGSGHLLIVALGELTVASILVLAGAVVLLPTVSGVNTPAGLIQYFAERAYGTLGNSPIAPYLPLVEFVLGAVLMTSAFYALRQAALNLKEAGLAIEPGKA